MVLVSIVVPIYKVEKYLSRCVQSLLNQTLKDIEIILVDDGSPDKCPEMCEDYLKADKRVKVVHKVNGGLSSARNVGIDVATGKYIGFVDSDDSILPTMYEELYNVINKYNCDFVMSDYERITRDGREKLKSLNIAKGYYDKNRIIKEIYPELIMGRNLDYGPLLSVWHCLYNSDFLRRYNLRFDEEVKWSEDNIFSAFVGYYANSFYYLKGRGLYKYYENAGTITTSYREGAWNVYCTMNDHLRMFLTIKKEYNFSQQLNLHQIYYACNCLGQLKHADLNKEVRNRKAQEILKSKKLAEAFYKFHYPKEWSWKLKVQIWLIRHKMWNVLKKI